MKETELAYINQTVEILKISLHDDPQEITRQLREAEGRVGYCYFLLAKADAELDQAQSQQLEAIIRAEGTKLPAYEKEVRVDAQVSGVREVRDRIAGIIKALEGRTMVGLGILRWKRNLPIE